jgi:hypothetical protein
VSPITAYFLKILEGIKKQSLNYTSKLKTFIKIISREWRHSRGLKIKKKPGDSRVFFIFRKYFKCKSGRINHEVRDDRVVWRLLLE